MQLKQFYDIAAKISSRKKCYYFWWSTWLLIQKDNSLYATSHKIWAQTAHLKVWAVYM